MKIELKMSFDNETEMKNYLLGKTTVKAVEPIKTKAVKGSRGRKVSPEEIERRTQILEEVIEKVKSGTNLNKALKGHPKKVMSWVAKKVIKKFGVTTLKDLYRKLNVVTKVKKDRGMHIRVRLKAMNLIKQDPRLSYEQARIKAREQISYDKMASKKIQKAFEETKQFPEFNSVKPESLNDLKNLLKGTLNGVPVDQASFREHIKVDGWFSVMKYYAFLVEFVEKAKQVAEHFSVEDKFRIKNNTVVYE